MATNGSEEGAASAGDAVREVQEKVAHGVEELRGWAESAGEAIRGFAREKPLLAVACAVGIGFLIGRLASRA